MELIIDLIKGMIRIGRHLAKLGSAVLPLRPSTLFPRVSFGFAGKQVLS